MSKTFLTYAATPIVVALATLSLGDTGLMAQERFSQPVHIRQPVVAAPVLQDHSTIAEVHIRQPALDDATIVAMFDNANTADIETGKLAAQRGHSNEVRQFGAMLARDHQMVRQQGRDLAKKLDVTPTPPSGDQSAQDHAAAMQRLSGLSGPEFDRAFLQHEVVFHEAAIAAIENTLLPSITNEELRAMVVKVAPAFKAHLDMARNLGQQLAAR
jgi:putative membrane protein